MKTSELMERCIAAFERGIDDGFFVGNEVLPDDQTESAFYRRGYDHGVWMYCETLEKTEKANEDI